MKHETLWQPTPRGRWIHEVERKVCCWVFALLGAGCVIADEEVCVLGESNGEPALTLESSPPPLDPADRIVSQEVREYLESRRQQRGVVATTVTKWGHVYDWIDINSQVPGGDVGTPPPIDAPSDASTADCAPMAVRSELEEDPEAMGPPGTVPVLWVDPDLIHAPGTVADFLSRYGIEGELPSYWMDVPPPVAPDGHGHYYAKAGLKKVAGGAGYYGGEGYFNVWNPFSMVPSEQSTVEVALAYKKDSSNVPDETVEAGWHVNGGLNGDFTTRFFVYYTTTRYAQQGDFRGGYNLNQAGWVQVSRTITPGVMLTPTSVLGGKQVEMYLRVELHQGKWWVRVKDEFVGYYPASMFTQDGLGTESMSVSFYGETNDDLTIPGMTENDMGSGQFPTVEGWRRQVAFMRNLQYQWSPDGDRTKFYTDRVGPTKKECYDIIANFSFAPNDPWQSQIYFGGPGRSAGCQ
ncbi:neprosin family prolyl endopeptidase [Polyangium sp. 15x6]|uniref:neprosin family prolyl endopeptidase n=1 Tax=Polyangium sp. 15x6 TaxID=3042687 RepID=UPI00249C0F8A|nr:neprosin family prolyl endopeptidase [Polyangium sp. 15x6]MDI3283221.1 neprosin family prolyl endopeptidase [Polyangium sp. 15x6]